MKAVIIISISVLLTLTQLLVGGCASKPARPDPNKIDWSQRIGNYTFDQAVADLGKPAVVGESSSGRTAEWVLRRSPRVSFGFGVGGGSFGHHSGMGVGAGTSVSPPPSGENLRLQFDGEGKLIEWTKVRY